MCNDFIRKTSERLELNIKAIKMDAIKYLSTISKSYNLIFADPPYHHKTHQYISLIETIFVNNLLKKEGLLIIEHSSQKKLESHPRFSQSRKYGSNVFSFFE